jgi:TatD DNase family protein
MNLFDAHNHLQERRLFDQLEAVMRRAADAGVGRMAVKGCCEEDWDRVIACAEQYPGCEMAFGIHPWFVGERTPQWFGRLEHLLEAYPTASVGEIGIDRAIDVRNDEEQEHVFLEQLAIAATLERPVSIHCRQAWGRLIELLDGFGPLPRGMLIHCFGGSAEVAQELVKRGGYISFSGSITRANNKKAGVALRAVPRDRLLIETDAPDLLPQTVDLEECLVCEGEPLNEPAHLRAVLARAAALLEMDEAELAALTSENAARFFAG